MGDVLSFYVDLSALPSQEALASLVPHVTSASEVRGGGWTTVNCGVELQRVKFGSMLA